MFLLNKMLVAISDLVEIKNKNKSDRLVRHTSKYAGKRFFTLSQKIVALLAVGLVIYILFFLHVQKQLIANTLLDQSKKQALVFLNGLEREIVSSPDPLNTEVLQNLIQQPIQHIEDIGFSVFRLYIYDKDGNVLADTSTESGKRKKIDEYVAGVLRSGKNYLGNEIEWKMDPAQGKQIPVVEVLIPLHLGGKVAGIIELEVDLVRTQKTIQQLGDAYGFRTIVISLVAGLVMLGFLCLVVHRGLLGPVLEIGKMSNRIADGDLSGRLRIRGHGELAHMATAVNTMADGIERLMEEQEEAYIQVLQSLAKALEAKDPYTAGHSSRVAKWSVKLAKFMGLPEEEIKILNQGALMHDLGKIAIPGTILNKPGRLTEQEFDAMRSHPDMTAHILQPLHRFTRHREIASWHHERWDGYGYPDGLKGDEIPLLVRIVSIADTWDAMTGDRVYRTGKSSGQALDVMINERDLGQWDPELLDLFIKLVRQSGLIEPDPIDD